MGTYIIRDVQDFLIERWGQKQMRSDVDLQLAAHAKQVRLENAQLREQNRVLASHLNNLVEWALEVTKDWTVDDDSTLANDLRMIWQAQAALTATSQPVPPYKEWCRHPDKCAGLASCPQDPTCAD